MPTTNETYLRSAMPVARIRRAAPDLKHEGAAHPRLDRAHVVPLLRHEAQPVAARQLVSAPARRGEHASLVLGGVVRVRVR